MKNIFKLLLAMILTFSFLTIGYAANLDEETKKGIEETKNFCLNAVGEKGCIYDENDTLYTLSGTVKNGNLATSLKIKDAKLTRGYQASDPDGNLAFAGCYKAYVSGDDDFTDGYYYVFKIVKLDGGKCKTTDTDIVPSKGMGYSTWIDDSDYDGVNGIGTDMAIYTGWIAENDGNCPLLFGLTQNTKWLTKTSNKYTFTNDESGILYGKKIAFGFGAVYERATGCTIEDRKGYEEAEACFNNAMAEIDSYKCPSDLSEMSKMSDDLKKYQEQCDSKLAKLYANKLLNDNAKDFSDRLKTKAEEKVNSCQLDKCKISSTQAEKIKQEKTGSKCATGCSVTLREQSNDENAQCYCCGGSASGCTYVWTEKPAAACARVKSKTKDKCIGTTDTDTCLECLENIYKKVGLNSEQKECMLDTEVQKTNAISNIKEDIDDQFEKQVEKKLQENEELYNNIENTEFDADLPAPGFGEGGETCKEIVGENIAKLIKLAINILRIVGAVIAIVNGMMTLIPAVVSKDPEALKKAGNKCIKLAGVLLVIGVFPTILKVIARIFGYDMSCIF